MNDSKIDIEKFISEVQKYPQIWNLNSDDYRYKKRKERAWGQVATEMIPGFEDLPESEKVITYKKLNDKWRNLRDSFVRAKRINSTKNYMYAGQLKFLKDVYRTSSQSESEEVLGDDRPKHKRPRNYRSRLVDRQECWNSEDSNPNPDLKRSLPRCEDDIEFVNTYPDQHCVQSIPSFHLEDEDKSFFDSLLPAVREFSLDQKLEFRCEVISLIKKIRN